MEKQDDLLNRIHTSAAVSAALRIPLTDLFARISVIGRSTPPPDKELRQQLEYILQDAYKLLRATSAISLTTSYQTEEPLLTPIYLWEELSQCMNAAETLLTAGGYHLEYEFPATNDVVSGDVQALTTAMLHLVCNALEASPRENTIFVRGSVHNDKAFITVTDSGCGIPPERLSHIFEPFYSVNSQGLPFQSLGLGLSLVQLILQRHGGAVQITSDSAGTMVICSLPLLQDDNALPLHSGQPLYLTDRYSPVYTVLCNFIESPWPY